MDYKYFLLPFLLIIGTLFLLVFAPIIDHLFYIDHKLEEMNDIDVLFTIIIHIIFVAILVYFFHNYIVSKYIKYFKLEKAYIKIIDLILALTLTGLQRNLVFKLRYLSNKHPFRSELIM